MIPAATLFRLGKAAVDAVNSVTKSDHLSENQKITEASKIDVTEILTKWNKANELFQSKILNEHEYSKEKEKIFLLISSRGLKQRPIECLTELLPMIDKGAISIDEAKQLKELFWGEW